MKKNIVILFIWLLSISCQQAQEISPDNIKYENGLLVSKDYLWNIKTTENNSFNYSNITPVVINDDHFLLGTQEENSCQISLVNYNSGEIQWTVNETDVSLSIYHVVNTGDSFIYPVLNKKQIKSRNIKTGEVIWAIIFENGINSFFTGNQGWFTTGSSGLNITNEHKLRSLWLGNTQTGEVREVTKPILDDLEINFERERSIGGYDMTVPFEADNGDLYILATGYYYMKDESIYNFFDLYNVAQDKFVFNNIVLSNLASSLPQIVDGVAYFALYQEFCAYDLTSGEKLWGRNYETYFDEHDFIIHDSTIFALQEGANDYLISLDRFSGRENWKVPAHQASSYIHYLDGVIYYTNGRLYAYDATNGQQLWSIESPDGTLFGSDCYAIPGKNGEKGKIIAGTGLHAYCYEAER